MLLLDLGTESLKFTNIVELYKQVIPFEWNSFCISVSPQKVLVIHNGKEQGMQNMTRNNAGQLLKTMTTGIIGGARFIGILSDLQIFGQELAQEDMIQWTSCENRVSQNMIQITDTYNKLLFFLYWTKNHVL